MRHPSQKRERERESEKNGKKDGDKGRKDERKWLGSSSGNRHLKLPIAL